MAVSSSSGTPPPDLNPLYQISKGSNGLPKRDSMKAATSFTIGDESKSVNNFSTSF